MKELSMPKPSVAASKFFARLSRLSILPTLFCFLMTMPITTRAQAAAPAQGLKSGTTNLTDAVSDPNQDEVLFFAETGHTLRGKFRAFWETHGGLPQFGYPLTEEFIESANGSLSQVQYFERNRFELHPENIGSDYEVLLGTLGREFHIQDPPVTQQPDTSIYFPETGHNLSGKFYKYWTEHGGLAMHGYPITEPAIELSTNGKEYLVQWFERSRFELHTENSGSEYEVLLGMLGKQSSEKKGYPYGWYPVFGRAVDYSWVAGRLLPTRACYFLECSCPLFAFGDPSGSPLGVGGIGWKDAASNGLTKSTNFLVVFGQQGNFAEVDAVCKPNFLVTKVQLNPASQLH